MSGQEEQNKTEGDKEVKLPSAVDIFKSVKESVDKAQGDGAVRQGVIDALANEIIQKRGEQILGAVRKREELAKDLKKISKPDVEAFDGEGKKTSESYSKTKTEEIKKAKEKLAKADKIINKAVEQAAYGEIGNLK